MTETPSAASPPTIDNAVRYLRDVVLPEADAHESAALRVLLDQVTPKSGQASGKQGIRARGRDAEPDDYRRTYESFWRPLVETDGKLDLDKVARELHDYSHLISEVPKVYVHVTGGAMSYPNYYAADVCSVADEHYEQVHGSADTFLDVLDAALRAENADVWARLNAIRQEAERDGEISHDRIKQLMSGPIEPGGEEKGS